MFLGTQRDNDKEFFAAVLVAVFVVMVMAVSTLWSWSKEEGTFGVSDPDPWLRLVIVEKLHHTGQWYDHRVERLDPPEGMVSPWTRPMDALLLAGATPLHSFLDFKSALFYWALFLNPLLLILSAILILHIVRRFPEFPLRYFFAVLAFLFSPIAMSYYRIGFFDHHALLNTLFVAFLFNISRMCYSEPLPLKRRYASYGGVFLGLGIWVSPEFTAAAFFFYLWLSLRWALGDPQALRVWYSSVWPTAVTLLAGLTLERSADRLWQVEFDTISLFHLLLFLLLLAIGTALHAVQRLTPHPWQRFLLGGVLGLLLLFLLQHYFPGFYLGPLARVDPEMITQFIANVREMQPLFRSVTASVAFAPASILFFIASAPVMLWILRNPSNEREFLSLLTLMGAGFTLLILQQVRWGYYAQTVYALMMVRALYELGRTGWSEQTRRIISLIAAFVPIYLIIGGALILDEEEDTTNKNDACEASFLAKIQTGDVAERFGQEPLLFMLPSNIGTQLLYWTPYRVLASNYHRNVKGYKDQLAFYMAETEQAARGVVLRRKPDVIVFCGADKTTIGPFLENITATGNMPSWLISEDALTDKEKKLYVFKTHLRIEE